MVPDTIRSMRSPAVRAGIYMAVWMICGTALGIYTLTEISVIGGTAMLLGAALFLGILVKGIGMRRSQQPPPLDE